MPRKNRLSIRRRKTPNHKKRRHTRRNSRRQRGGGWFKAPSLAAPPTPKPAPQPVQNTLTTNNQSPTVALSPSIAALDNPADYGYQGR